MTSQPDQLQKLIQEIDGVLGKTSPRLPWVVSGDVAQQRRVLEQTRRYLLSLQQRGQQERPEGAQSAGALTNRQGLEGQSATAERSAQQALQAIAQEMAYLRSNMMQPLQSDIETLRHQREVLAQEVRQLESQRQQQALPQQPFNQQQVITEFLQVLMGRLQETLTGEVTQTLARLESQPQQERSLPGSTPQWDQWDQAVAPNQAFTPEQRLEQVRMIQAQSDQLLLRLDSTLRLVFESLQSDVQSYQDSLAQGLEKMHGLGQRGEAMFAALVNHLAQQLGREASSYLQSKDWEAGKFPGLREALRVDDSERRETLQPAPIDRLDPSADFASDQNPGSPEAASEASEDETLDLFLLDETLALFQDVSDSDQDEDLTTLQLDEELAQIQSELEADIRSGMLPSTATEPGPPLEPTLNLLEQLGSESQEDETPSVEPESSLEATSTAGAGASEADTPESIYNELDEFYESLFGDVTPGEETPLTSFAPDETYAAMLDEPSNQVSDSESLDSEPFAQPVAAAESPGATAQTPTPFAEPVAEAEMPDAEAIATGPDLFPEEDWTLASLEDQLFGGLADPAETGAETEAGAEAEVEAGTGAESLPTPSSEDGSSASWEDLLFDQSETLDDPLPFAGEGDEGQAEPAATVEDWFLEFGESDSTAAPAVPSADEAQLLDADLRAELAETSRLASTEADAPTDTVGDLIDDLGDDLGDRYVPASPDEDLLVGEDTPPRTEVDLRLDVNTLQQLTADLSGLEGLEDTEFLASFEAFELDVSESGSAPEDSSDWAADWPESGESDESELGPESETESELGLGAIAESDLDDFLLSPAAEPEAQPSDTEEPFEEDLTLGGFAETVDSEPLASSSVADTPAEADEASEEIGLDDLFAFGADQPSAPDVEPASDPSASDPTELGWDDATPAPIPEGTPSNVEDILEDLFSLGETQPLTPTAERSVEATNLWEEFGFAPNDLATGDPESNLSPESASFQSSSAAANATADATAEGTSDPNTFTLEGIDSLFEDLSALPTTESAELPPTKPTSDPALETGSQSWTLDSIFENFSETPEPPSQTESEAEAGFDLFEDAPSDQEDPEKKNALILEQAGEDLGQVEAVGSPVEVAMPSPTPAPIVPSEISIDSASDKVWYLGIDIGTTGISAVLLDRNACKLYPVYWSELQSEGQDQPVVERFFRLPTTVSVSTADLAEAAADGSDATTTAPLVAIGSLAVDLTRSHQAEAAIDPSRLLLRDFKPYLRLGIPYYTSEAAQWEPVLQWSDHQQISLSWLYQALQSLLATLNATLPNPNSNPPLTLSCGAVGLAEGVFQTAIRHLAGVVVGQPINWSDTYSFNIREAVLGAKLVDNPAQVFFIEDAIAALLSGLRSSEGQSVVLPQTLAPRSHLYNVDWQGATLAVSAGATVTELAIVDLPYALQSLSYQDFTTRSLPYAGNAIDQDIICQLLYPAGTREAQNRGRSLNPAAANPAAASNTLPPATADWSWQAGPSLDHSMWSDLRLEDLELPLPGEPDRTRRLLLQQRLESSALGQSLLESARYLKLILQHQDQFTLNLGGFQLMVLRQDLIGHVFVPYIQRLNRELNTLLAQTGILSQAVKQIICTGGTASIVPVSRWLRQKFPQATIVQDTYISSRTSTSPDFRPASCSRIAYGLATLPLHSRVLNLPRQQYNDYFLLLELLRAFPDRPLSVGSIMQLLERRGINTQVCHLHILALLEGHLPPGLVPTAHYPELFAPQSRERSDYQLLLSAPLFEKQDNQTYRPNPTQWARFRRYLDMLMVSTHQELAEPLPVSLSYM